MCLDVKRLKYKASVQLYEQGIDRCLLLISFVSKKLLVATGTKITDRFF